MGMHLFASFLFDIPNVPRKLKKLLAIVISAVSAAFCLILAFLAAQLVMQTYMSGRTTPSLGIPFYTFYIALPVSFVLMALHNARALICNLRQKDYALSPEKEVN
jgi:TRAP-type C4-dicarboxylate transport system permease small subunit